MKRTLDAVPVVIRSGGEEITLQPGDDVEIEFADRDDLGHFIDSALMERLDYGLSVVNEPTLEGHQVSVDISFRAEAIELRDEVATDALGRPVRPNSSRRTD